MVRSPQDRPKCEACGVRYVHKGPKINGKQYWSRVCQQCPSPGRRTPEQRFLRYVRKDGCWEWLGAKDRAGYGRFAIATNRSVASHRWAYGYYVGEIPDGFFVCHRCDNPGCVNPDHLFIGTHKDNMDDMVHKGRSAGGSQNPNAKLSEGDVLAIRASTKVKAAILAEKYGVGVRQISLIQNGRAWR